MSSLLFVNPRSGDAAPSTGELAEAARSAGVGVHVLGENDDLAALAREADADVLGIAGGDGSLGAVAQACVERGLPFVCVPFGTRNHFARDLGVDRGDPLGALAAFADGAAERRVDIGRANRRVFLNNVSLGLYAGLVHDRERRRRRREAFARAKALGRLVSERRPVEITVDGAPLSSRLVLVAVNAYGAPSAFSIGGRERLDGGRLVLYVATPGFPPAWEERELERVTVDADAHLRAAVDGEPVELETPLELAVEQAALRVRLPDPRE